MSSKNLNMITSMPPLMTRKQQFTFLIELLDQQSVIPRYLDLLRDPHKYFMDKYMYKIVSNHTSFFVSTLQ